MRGLKKSVIIHILHPMGMSLSRMMFVCFVLVAFQASTTICQNAAVVESSGVGERVVVLPFEARGISPDEGLRLKQKFAEVFAESKRFDVMPDNVLKNNLELSRLSKIDSCNTLPCLAQLGKVLNVEKIVHVSVDQWKDRYVLRIRVVGSSDAALLYDERVDYTGDFSSLLSTVVPEQARKLDSAFLDKKPNWYLIAAGVIVGVGLIYWIYSTFSAVSSTEPEISTPPGSTK